MRVRLAAAEMEDQRLIEADDGVDSAQLTLPAIA